MEGSMKGAAKRKRVAQPDDESKHARPDDESIRRRVAQLDDESLTHYVKAAFEAVLNRHGFLATMDPARLQRMTAAVESNVRRLRNGEDLPLLTIAVCNQTPVGLDTLMAIYWLAGRDEIGQPLPARDPKK